MARSGKAILSGIDFTVLPGEQWLVFGPNGAGKTTMLSVVSARAHPTTGKAIILGEELGRTDVRVLRRRIGLSSPFLARQFRPNQLVEEVVMTGRKGELETWWSEYDDSDLEEATRILCSLGMGDFVGREFSTLSSGELREVQIARAIVGNPELLILDEPAAGLDLGARERLLEMMPKLLADRTSTILVTHHVEEVPPGITHGLLLSGGAVVSKGPIEESITSDTLSATFGIPLELSRSNGRMSCRLSSRDSSGSLGPASR